MLEHEKRFVSEDNLKSFTRALNDKQQTQILITNSRIEASTARLDAEVTRAQAAEETLHQDILNESTRASSSEEALDIKIQATELAAKQYTDDTKLQLQTTINTEVQARRDEVSRLELDYTQKLAAIDEAHRVDIGNQINTIAGQLRTDYQNADQLIQANLNNEISARQKYESTQNSTNKAINERITAEIQEVTKNITDHNSQYSVLNTQVTEHIQDKNNPHQITPQGIGAATATDHSTLEKRVAVVEATSNQQDVMIQNIISDTGQALSGIQELKADTEELLVSKISTNGSNQILTGDLTIVRNSDSASGNLVVQGDLEVKGTTKTYEHETLAVKDNFLVLNSDNEEVGTALTGIALRVGTDEHGKDTTYGIVYDKLNDSISLGKGQYSNGDFTFDVDESKPILTRDVSNNIQDGHLLIWDAEKNIAVDGGAYSLDAFSKTFTTWDAHHALVVEVESNDSDIADLQLATGELNESLMEVRSTADDNSVKISALETDIDKLNNYKQNVNDAQLKTTAKTITGSINEIFDKQEAHRSDADNPHNVTWNQIRSAALNDVAPKMNGTASAGVLTTVSRSDHIHPTDTSRAPVNHASGSNTYGQATSSLYGHVLVDEAMSDVSVNPVQNNVVKKFVEDQVKLLTIDTINIHPDHTLSSISEIDGKISVDTQPIYVSMDQVDSLTDSINQIHSTVDQVDARITRVSDSILEEVTSVRTALISETTTSRSAEKTLQDNIDAEASDRLSGDAALSSMIETTKSDLESMVTSDRQRLTRLEETVANVTTMSYSIADIEEAIRDGREEYTSLWTLTFEQVVDASGNVSYKPYFTKFDDGILV